MTRTDWIILGVVVLAIGAVTLVFAIKYLLRLIAVRRMLGELGMKGNLVFWGAIAYTIFPVDLLPDPIYLDDMAVLGAAVFYLNRLLRKKETLQDGLPHLRRVAEVQRRRNSRPRPLDRTR